MLVPPELLSTAFAVTFTDPLKEGFHVQVATNGEDVVVDLFLQPDITIFLALKVTFASALTFAVMVTGVRYEAFGQIVSELKTRLTGIFSANIPKLYLVFK